MLERGKVCSSAAIATALADSSGNQICSDGDGIASSLQLSNERYACNSDSVYAIPKTDLHEIEWIDPDSIDAEVSRLVAGSSTTTTRNNPRRCCRTSTSSGYSSHSPPLSAGSYSFYAPAGTAQGSFRAAAPMTMRDQLGGGLAVIHEGEAIPRPIWPSAFHAPREFCHGDDEYDGLCACYGCSCAYTYSYCDWDYGQKTTTSAREVLLELSRTLNSVIEGETAMTPEEILHNISHTVAEGMGMRKGGIHEYAFHNSCKHTVSKLPGHRSPSANCEKSSKVNPVNSKLYGNSRHCYVHNSLWSAFRCTCHHRKCASSTKPEEGTLEVNDESMKREGAPAVFLVNDHHQVPENGALQCHKAYGVRICKCSNRIKSTEETCNAADRHAGINAKEAAAMNGSIKQPRNGPVSGEPEYSMQLESSDGGSSSEGIVVSGSKGDWGHRVAGFAGELDFTLDVTRAERLGRAIAKAKRKRQWCRALTALFGLVFFVLSVVVVSLSVTRGRKVFGSM